MHEARLAGKVKRIGVTGYPLAVQKELLIRCAAKGIEVDNSIAYCHYSLNDTTLVDSGFLQFVQSKGMGMVNASPISMGLLTPSGPPGWHPANHREHVIAAAKSAAERCAKAGVVLPKLAMHFTL